MHFFFELSDLVLARCNFILQLSIDRIDFLEGRVDDVEEELELALDDSAKKDDVIANQAAHITQLMSDRSLRD